MTCPLNWSVQGVWPEVYDGNDVNAVHVAQKRKLIAMVTEGGLIKVYKQPCLDKRAKYASGFGHSKHATNVRWTCDETHFITLGGTDRTVMMWKVENVDKRKPGEVNFDEEDTQLVESKR